MNELLAAIDAPGCVDRKECEYDCADTCRKWVNGVLLARARLSDGSTSKEENDGSR